jgi:hypothetical protein
MTDGGQIRIDRWLRTEHLEEDVLSLLKDLGAASPGVVRLVGAVGRRNAASYDHDLATHFSATQIRQMYERNPVWAEIERSTFGNLLCDQLTCPTVRLRAVEADRRQTERLTKVNR